MCTTTSVVKGGRFTAFIYIDYIVTLAIKLIHGHFINSTKFLRNGEILQLSSKFHSLR